ncbi:TPA: hypothetical protein ACX387_005038, partial [Klebsiella pneumoniae]
SALPRNCLHHQDYGAQILQLSKSSIYSTKPMCGQDAALNTTVKGIGNRELVSVVNFGSEFQSGMIFSTLTPSLPCDSESCQENAIVYAHLCCHCLLAVS